MRKNRAGGAPFTDASIRGSGSATTNGISTVRGLEISNYSNFDGKEDLLPAVMRHRLESESRTQADRLHRAGRRPAIPPSVTGSSRCCSRRGAPAATLSRLPGNGLGELPYERADAILKSLDIGMRLLTLLAPEQCPPELFRTALGLLTAPRCPVTANLRL
ncbi:hypothetical protein ACIHFD_17050 [Nonomuraea sp. NPDC051941]|uniref:hypothetical protein n=1 Tax=Nonomuraea sp. NPDC051941 TaxID=3364373 RepID=UPI0037C6A7EC